MVAQDQPVPSRSHVHLLFVLLQLRKQHQPASANTSMQGTCCFHGLEGGGCFVIADIKRFCLSS